LKSIWVLSLLNNIINKIREIFIGCKRVLIIAKKPDWEEFVKTIKICVIGMGLIGLIGFLIYSISIFFLPI